MATVLSNNMATASAASDGSFNVLGRKDGLRLTSPVGSGMWGVADPDTAAINYTTTSRDTPTAVAGDTYVFPGFDTSMLQDFLDQQNQPQDTSQFEQLLQSMQDLINNWQAPTFPDLPAWPPAEPIIDPTPDITTNYYTTTQQLSPGKTYKAGDALELDGKTFNVLYDNISIGVNGSNQLVALPSAEASVVILADGLAARVIS